MKIAQEKLLFDTFIAFNKTRFADQPEMLALFDTLTSEELVIALIEHELTGSMATINGPGFTAPETTYIKADISKTVNGWTFANTDGPIDPYEELGTLDTSGVYQIVGDGETKVGVVLIDFVGNNPAAIQTAANALLRDSHFYDIGDGQYEPDGEFMQWAELSDAVSLHGKVPVYIVSPPDVDLGGGHLGELIIPETV